MKNKIIYKIQLFTVIIIFTFNSLVFASSTKFEKIDYNEIYNYYNQEILKKESNIEIITKYDESNIENYTIKAVLDKEKGLRESVESWGYKYIVSNGYIRVTNFIEYNSNGDMDSKQKFINETIDNILKEIIKPNMNDYEKEKAIRDWIVDNISYDYTYSNYYTYEALTKKTVVCNGYAELFYDMAKRAGLHVIKVIGLANNSISIEDHAWNMIEIDGIWYHVDLTWDDAWPFHYYNLTDEQIATDHEIKSDWPKANTDFMKVLNIKAKENPEVFIPLVESMQLHKMDRNYYKISNYEDAKKIIIDLSTQNINTFNFIVQTENKEDASKLFNEIKKNFFDMLKDKNIFVVSFSNSVDVKKCLNDIRGYSFKITKKYNIISPFIPQNIDSETFNTLKNNDNISAKVQRILVPTYIPTVVGETIRIVPFADLGTNVEIPNDELVWQTDNKSVATVESNGNIKIVGKGSACINVTLKSNSKVNENIYIETINPTVFLNEYELNLKIGDKYTIKANIKDSNNIFPKYIWKSSNPKVASVDNNGNIIALKEGYTTISVREVYSGAYTECWVFVKSNGFKFVLLGSKEINLNKGQTFSLKYQFSTTNKNKKLVFISSNTKVAEISSSGIIKAVNKGTATITIKTNDGIYLKSCKIIVN